MLRGVTSFGEFCMLGMVQVCPAVAEPKVLSCLGKQIPFSPEAMSGVTVLTEQC